MKLIALVTMMAFLSACSTSVSLVSRDGKNIIKGSLMNGSVSYSEGDACAPAVPSPGNAAPVQPSSAPLMTPRMVCDAGGQNCKAALMAADTATPTCYTQVGTVHGTDVTTYFAWALGSIGAIMALVFAHFGA